MNYPQETESFDGDLKQDIKTVITNMFIQLDGELNLLEKKVDPKTKAETRDPLFKLLSKQYQKEYPGKSLDDEIDRFSKVYLTNTKKTGKYIFLPLLMALINKISNTDYAKQME